MISMLRNILSTSPQDKPIITTLQKKWRFEEAGKWPEALIPKVAELESDAHLKNLDQNEHPEPGL